MGVRQPGSPGLAREGVSGRGRSCVADRRSRRWCPRPPCRGAARASSGSEEPPHGVDQPERGGRSAPLPKSRWPLHRLRLDRPPRLWSLGASAPGLSRFRIGCSSRSAGRCPNTVRGRWSPGAAFVLNRQGVLLRRRTAESAARDSGSRRSPDHQGPASGRRRRKEHPGVVARATSGIPLIDAPPKRPTGRRAGT